MEMDYWGLTYQEALRYILDHDTREKITVYADNGPGEFNVELLKEYQKKRLEVDRDTSKKHDYKIGNYRWMQTEYYDDFEIYAVERDSAKICVVIKLQN